MGLRLRTGGGRCEFLKRLSPERFIADRSGPLRRHDGFITGKIVDKAHDRSVPFGTWPQR